MNKRFFLCILLLAVVTGCSKEPVKQEQIPVEVKEEPRHATLAFTGDNLLEDGIYYWMSDHYTKDTYDFKTYFDAIRPYLQADLVIGNEEVPIAGRTYGITGSNFTFNAPEEIAAQLYDLDFDVLTFANNHSYDRGFEGIEQTLQILSDAGIKTTGSFVKEEDVKPLIIEKNGIRFGIVAYTYDTNQPIDPSVSFSVNQFLNDAHEFDDVHQQMIKEQIDMAKKEADVIIAAMHWGNEFTYELSRTQEELALFLNECGVDIIVGNHPHTLQTVDTLTNKEGKETFVMYSLGNFISSAANVDRASEQFTNMYEIGGIVNCEVIFDPTTRKVSITQKKLHAIVNHFTYGYDNFALIPFASYSEELANQHYQRMYSTYFNYEYLKENLSHLFDGRIAWD